MEREAWEAGAQAWVDRVADADWAAHDASIRSLLPAPAGPALDVGCGEGRLTRLLRALGHDVTGLDRSRALVEHARRRDPGGRYEVAPVEALPTADGGAALVLCVNVLPHVPQLDAAVAELARVVAPGGAVVVGFRHPVALAGSPGEDGLLVRRYFVRERHPVPLGDGEVEHHQRTVADYLRAFLAAGLTLSDVREVADAAGAPAFLDLRLRRG